LQLSEASYALILKLIFPKLGTLANSRSENNQMQVGDEWRTEDSASPTNSIVGSNPNISSCPCGSPVVTDLPISIDVLSDSDYGMIRACICAI
jgi:hypothetical protein